MNAIKAALKTFHYIRKDHKNGYKGEHVLVRDDEMDKIVSLINNSQQEIKLYERCMEHIVHGGSACAFCDDQKLCKKARSRTRGCSDWMIRIPTQEDIDFTWPETETHVITKEDVNDEQPASEASAEHSVSEGLEGLQE